MRYIRAISIFNMSTAGKTGGQSLVFFTSNNYRYVLAIVIKEGGLSLVHDYFF